MMIATQETQEVPMYLLQDDEDNTLPEAAVGQAEDPEEDEDLEDEDDELEDDDEELEDEDEDAEDEELDDEDLEDEDEEDEEDDEDDDVEPSVPPTATRL